MGYLLVLMIAVFGGIISLLKKKYVEDTANVKASLEIYIFLSYFLAMLYFFVLAKGEVTLNLPTFLFALAFAVVAICSNVFGMAAYRFTSLIYITVFTGAGATVIPFGFELILRGETFSGFEILSVILRLAAVCVPVFMMEKKTKNTKIGIIICILLFVISGAENIVSKLYGEHPDVGSDSSFCFWTNVITIPFIFVSVLKQTGIKEILSQSRKIKGIDYACVLVSIAIGNISTLLTIQALRLISATVYSVLFSSLSMIITVLISVCLYKEKLAKETVMSIIFSILAIVSGVL